MTQQFQLKQLSWMNNNKKNQRISDFMMNIMCWPENLGHLKTVTPLFFSRL